MQEADAKIERELATALAELDDHEKLDVLVYPSGTLDQLAGYLRKKKKRGEELEYNVLELAGCVVVRAPKTELVALARREEVERLGTNPRFTV